MIRLIRSFIVKKEGVAAIEFAILAPIFFALMTAIFEITYFVYSNTAIQRAVENVIYDLRTGNVYAELAAADNPPPLDWFKNQICGQISIPNCQQNVHIIMQKYDTNYDSFGNSEETNVYDTGASGILMRMEAEVTVPNIVLTKAIFGEESMTISGGLTFMTEPY